MQFPIKILFLTIFFSYNFCDVCHLHECSHIRFTNVRTFVFAKISFTSCLFLTFVALIWKRPPLVSNFQYFSWLSLIWVIICKIKNVFFWLVWVFICKIQKQIFFLQFLQCLSSPWMFSHLFHEHRLQYNNIFVIIM